MVTEDSETEVSVKIGRTPVFPVPVVEVPAEVWDEVRELWDDVWAVDDPVIGGTNNPGVEGEVEEDGAVGVWVPNVEDGYCVVDVPVINGADEGIDDPGIEVEVEEDELAGIGVPDVEDDGGFSDTEELAGIVGFPVELVDPVVVVDVVVDCGVISEGELSVVVDVVATGVDDEGDDATGELFAVPGVMLHGRACAWRRSSTKTRIPSCCILALNANAHLSRPEEII